MFYEIHKKRFEIKNHKTFGITIRRIERLFLEWTKKRDNSGMKSLKLTSENRTKNRKGRPKEITINDLSENDRRVYQEIIKDHDISKHEIQERMKKKKEKIENVKKLSTVCHLNKTSIYYKNKAKKTSRTIINKDLSKDIYNLISISNKSIWRDKCYLSLNNKYKISSFNFRKH